MLPNLALSAILTDSSFWLLLAMTLCSCGAGLTFIHNLKRHVKALSSDQYRKGGETTAEILVVVLAGWVGLVFSREAFY